jgi:two-component system, chemotaxis family, protein-glutamate methylesterase/glutaminase
MATKQLVEATCPECRGPLSAVDLDGLREIRCLVGHVYGARSLLQAHSETQESALWAAVVALEEAINLVEFCAPDLPSEVLDSLRLQCEKKRVQANQIRQILNELEPFQAK